MKYTFAAVWGSGAKPHAWIGPVKNLAPTDRRRMGTMDKQILLKRQNGTCNCCGHKIELYPQSNCDADHVVPVTRGGETLLQNMQLLAVQCHRRKTLSESRNSIRMVNVAGELDSKQVYIFSSEPGQPLQFPVDKRTPMECIENDYGLSLLTYKKVDRTYTEPLDAEVDYEQMLWRFAYTPESK